MFFIRKNSLCYIFNLLIINNKMIDSLQIVDILYPDKQATFI
ncbi:hypothetical protein ESA_01431 [Cronobacter sakazakii ATCC BAA-894]|uniref:Uncharacterized protein n=1 Tax=Cronobacter sakazakii (strain ATCC BAA-894) TaxID=290339 RepID=A7MKF4_CROS8|nr:hypothetical protein ESA_01431 [Cronobacter sakazakii ATCC BAA-894]